MMKVYVLYIIQVFIFSTQFQYCGSKTNKEIEPPKIKKVIDCKAPDEIALSDTLAVILKEYPGTGYLWVMDNDSTTNKGIHFIEKKNISRNENDENNSRMVEFDFSFSEKSVYEFRFIYIRPTDKTRTAENSCVFKVDIK